MAVRSDPKHSRLMEPLTLRDHTLRNRVVFGAHTSNMSEGGLPGDQHLHYYLERARGGAAMIVVEPQPVHETAVLTRGNFRVADDAVIPAFRRITEACKAEGAVILQQLYHVGQHWRCGPVLSPELVAFGAALLPRQRRQPGHAPE